MAAPPPTGPDGRLRPTTSAPYRPSRRAVAALVVLVALGILVCRAYLRAGDRGARHRAALATGGALVVGLALVALVAATADIQGAMAPFSPLMSMLPVESPPTRPDRAAIGRPPERG